MENTLNTYSSETARLAKPAESHDEEGHDHSHIHLATPGTTVVEGSGWKGHWDLLLSLAILLFLLGLRYIFHVIFPQSIDLGLHIIALGLSAYKIFRLAFRRIKRGDFFNEFVLMSVASLGAFYIGAYSEGVAVMAFYCIGEWFQDTAVDNAKRNIKALLDVRPDKATVYRNNTIIEVDPSTVELKEIIRVKPGEKVALDGILVSETGSFNTAALTGESAPDTKTKGEAVFAGMVNLNTPADIEVTALFRDSKLSRILAMVQDASGRKARTQLFISRLARIYTPVVFFLALSVCVGPYFFVEQYDFNTWFYRALVFLVISCPCALVVSIPLGYFGGIGAGSRNGILFKGSNFLDLIRKVNYVVMDKTGTLT